MRKYLKNFSTINTILYGNNLKYDIFYYFIILYKKLCKKIEKVKKNENRQFAGKATIK